MTPNLKHHKIKDKPGSRKDPIVGHASPKEAGRIEKSHLCVGGVSNWRAWIGIRRIAARGVATLLLPSPPGLDEGKGEREGE
jgi:hypothetical protein